MRVQEQERPLRGSRADRRKRARARRFRFVLWFGVSCAASVFLVVLAMIVVGFATPWGNKTRLMIAETIISTRHYAYARWITTPTEYARMLKALSSAPVYSSTISKIHVAAAQGQPSPITLIPLHEDGYTGDVMLIHNPKLIRLVPAKVTGQEGEYITDMIPRVGAIAGINASGFEDPNGEGWGGVPVGLMYVNGHQLNESKTTENWATVGFTSDGVLVLGNYTTSELRALNVRDAMQFHPELVVDGEPMITDGDMSEDPRTAIGQTKDGTVIFVVINGRFKGGAISAPPRNR